MKKILVALMLFAVTASAEMKVVDVPVQVICWDSLTEALDYHAGKFGELPIVKLYSGEDGGGILLVKPDKTKWTFLAFKKDKPNNRTIVCAFFEGSAWDVINVPETQDKIEL